MPIADADGDWAFHCHKAHHTMNAMDHQVSTIIGVDHRQLVSQINKLIPDYMVMGERGMGDMTEMGPAPPRSNGPGLSPNPHASGPRADRRCPRCPDPVGISKSGFASRPPATDIKVIESRRQPKEDR